MKVLKIGVFAMALGFFAASCSNSSSTEGAATTDSTQVETPAAPATDSAAPATTDSTAAPAATTDSTTAK